jgi:polyisoprenoid-binding protein YceI
MSPSESRSPNAASGGSSTAAAEIGVYTIDPVHSTVGFSVRHLMITNVHGEFTRFRATVHFDPDELGDCAVEALIRADSIHTGNSKRDEHLCSGDFFDTANHPRLVYRSTRFYRNHEGRLLIDGELSMRGRTERIGLVATGRINRHDFGIDWNQRLEGGGILIGREVELTLDLSLIRKSE